MASVDDRIVAMKFDNAAFEQKLATTMGSLDKLKGSLDFANSKRGLDDLKTAGQNFNLDGIAASTDHISSKFSAMGVVAFGVISNIVSAAFNAGVSIVKSLALDQVLAGFHEYETNMNAIQTILSNTKADATTLDQVNGALETLNTYSDQTIYNFSQMAKNVGTFTAAGVNLDTSVGAIKGIANLAAVSGSNAEQASSAMYQLSQALASGSVKLMDWNSIVNAGMGGEVFQKSLFDTAKALGTIKDVPMKQTFDQWKDAGNTFRGSLEQGWVTADVLTASLSTFTGDLTEAQILAMGFTQDQVAGILEMGTTAKDAATKVKTFTQLIGTVKESIGSGWTKSFQIVFGTFDEARELFTGINDAIGKFVGASADARNSLLQGWKDLGGRTALIEGLRLAFVGIAGILKPIAAAFRSIFPPMTAQRLFDITEGFKNLMESIKPSPAIAVLLTRIFRGVFSAFSIGIDIVKGIFGFFKLLFQLFTTEGDPNSGILGFAARLGDKISYLKTVLDRSNGITDFFTNLAMTIKHLVTIAQIHFDKFMTKVAEVIDYFVGGFTGMWTNEGEGILLFANQVGMAIGNIRDKIIEFIDHFTAAFSGEGLTGPLSGISDVAWKLGDAFAYIRDKGLEIYDWITTQNPFEKMSSASDGTFDAFGRIGQRLGWITRLGAAFGKIFEWAAGMFPAVQEAFGKFGDFLSDTFEGVPQAIADALSKGDYSQALDTINTGLFGGLVLMIGKFLKGDMFGGGLFKTINKSFETLTGTLKSMQTEIKAEALQKIAIAVGILVASMLVLSLIDSADLTKALLAMSIGFAQLVGVMALLDQIAGGVMDATKLTIMAAGLILLAGAILIMSIAVKILSTMSWEELSKGLLGVTVLLGVITAAMKLMPDDQKMISTGVAILLISVALNILALAVKSFAEMSWEEMLKGMTGVAVGLGIIVAAMQLMPSDKDMIEASVAIGLIAVALNILALAVKSFAEMTWEEMIKGMTGVAVGLGLIVAAMQLVPKKDMMGTSVAILIISVALNVLALAVKAFAEMKWAEMAKGMAGVAAVLLIIAGAMHLMPKNMLSQAAALLLISIALLAMASALKAIGSMSWGEIAKGLVGIAATLVILAVAAHAMESAIPGALAIGIMAVAMVVMAHALKEFGSMSWGELLKGLVGLAAAMAVLALGALAIQPAIPALLLLGLALILVGAGMTLFGLGAELLATAFALIATAGTQGVATLISVLDALIGHLPAIIVAFGKGIVQLAKVLVDALPGIIAGLDDVITALCDLLIRNIPKIAKVFTTFILTLIEVIEEVTPKIIEAGLTLLLALLQGIADNIGEIVTAVADIITNFLNALTEKLPEIIAAGIALLVAFLTGIGDNIGLVIEAAIGIVTSIITALGEAAVDIIAAGKDFLLKVIEGIGSGAVEIVAAVALMIVQFLDACTQLATDIVDAGKTFIVKLIEGFGNAAIEIAAKLGVMIIQFINEVTTQATAIMGAGKTFIVKLIEGFTDAVTEIGDAIVAMCVIFKDQCLVWAQKLADAGVAFILGILKIGADAVVTIADGMFVLLTTFLNELANVVRLRSGELRDAGLNLIEAVIEGMTGGLTGGAARDGLMEAALNLGWDVLDGLGMPFDLGSPSRVTFKFAGMLAAGLAMGFDKDTSAEQSAISFGDRVLTTFQKSLSQIPDALEGMNEFSPTITPVLDLTNVAKEASKLGGMLGTSSLTAAQAVGFSIAANTSDSVVDTKLGSREIKFEQTINSPTALSTADIYRQTRNQIAMAKEELAVL